MDWSWYSIHIILLCMIFPRDYVQANDDRFKEALLQEFEQLLDAKLNSKMNHINGELNTIKSKLDLVYGAFAGIETSVQGFDGRSSASQLATEAVKKMQVTMSDDLRAVKEKVETYENSINEIKSVKNKVDSYEDPINEIISVKQKVESFEESINEIRNIKNKVEYCEGSLNEIVIVRNKVDSYEDPINAILTVKHKVESFEDSIIEIKTVKSKIDSNEESISKIKSLNDITLRTKKLSEKNNSTNSEISQKITDLAKNTIESNDILLNSLIASTVANGCQDGFLVSTHCFKVFWEKTTDWTEAENLCHSQNFTLAEPSDRVALVLSRFLLQGYGEGSFWVNSKGDGGKFVWKSNNKAMDGKSGLWSPGQPGDRVSSNYCLSLLVSEEDWERNPGQPYHPHDCSETWHYPLCERSLKDSELEKPPLLALEEKLDTINRNVSKMLQAVSSLKDAELEKLPLLAIEDMMDTINRNVSKMLQAVNGTYDWSAQFKIYKDQKRTWAEAKEKCEQEGYILAQPSESIAVHLRRYLLENYGDQSRVWLGAKGDGSNYVWQKGGLTLRNDSPVWANDQPGSYVSADYCLYLVVTMGHNSNHPENPYYTSKCSNPSFTTYALCEVN